MVIPNPFLTMYIIYKKVGNSVGMINNDTSTTSLSFVNGILDREYSNRVLSSTNSDNRFCYRCINFKEADRKGHGKKYTGRQTL